MNKIKLVFSTMLLSISITAQTDFSGSWEDFFSYNNVIDFYQDDTQIIALTENALFTYNKTQQTYDKFSSIRGLSGYTSSAFYYNTTLKKIVIGYQNGMIEVVDSKKRVYRKPEIINFNVSGNKAIQKIIPLSQTEVLLAMPFGIVRFNVQTLDFGNTYFIGNLSSEIMVHDILVHNNTIYAATANGLYVADANDPYLIDFNNWTHYPFSDVNNIEVINNTIVLGINNGVYRLLDNFTLAQIGSFADTVVSITASDNYLTISNASSYTLYGSNLNYLGQVFTYNPNFYFNIKTAYVFQNKMYLATNLKGILITDIFNTGTYSEIHPEGPIKNNVFSITAGGNYLWVVYGRYNDSYEPSGNSDGVTYYNGTNWKNIYYPQFGVNYNDLVHVSLAPDNPKKAFISSWGKGMLVIENDAVIHAWNNTNSGLEAANFPNDTNTIRIGASVFDTHNNLWIGWLYNKIFRYSASGQWTTFDLSSVATSLGYGINEIEMDKSGNKWMATSNNGALVFNENGNKMMSINADPANGNLPEKNITALAVDKNNRVWIGTTLGLRYFDSSADVFSVNLAQHPAKPVVIVYSEEENIGEALLGNQKINSICVDGADNKWFGTENSGVLCTDYSGAKTLFQFDKTNSPLPSNKIVDIQFEPLNGKIYFATDKGIVAYNSNISPYGEHLDDIYAYPNPVKNTHETVTIAGRNGSNIPYGTNVKILDVAGKLVFETNVKEGQEDFGGKVVWNKKNLAGTKVASGVYIVLMYYKDKKETATAKIAIIN